MHENAYGADRDALMLFAGLVADRQEIEPDFQRVINLLIVQSVFFDKLPPKKQGRPKDESSDITFSVAYSYYEMVDAGVNYAEAVQRLTERFHKDERHLMRLVRAGKESCGDTVEMRQRNREWLTLCADMRERSMAEGKKPHLETMLEMFAASEREQSQRDIIAETDKSIDGILSSRFATDTK